MKSEARVVITNPTGLHARPAVKLTKLAKTFPAAIRVRGAPDGSSIEVDGKAVGVVSKDMGDKIAQAGEIYLASYSRDQESEADAVGMQLSAAAGYDPSELAGALIGIERSVELLSGEKHEPTFFDTHPTTPTRVADVDKLAAKLPWSTRAPIAGQQALYAQLDGLWWL